MAKLKGRFVVDEWTPQFLSQNSVNQVDGNVDVVAHSSTKKCQKRKAEEKHEHSVAGKSMKLKEKQNKKKEKKNEEKRRRTRRRYVNLFACV